MAFTANELASIANAALDFHLRRQPFYQTIQDKPALRDLVKGKKTFPGGKGDITIPVKGKIQFEGASGSLTGYTHDDTVAYGKIAGIERAKYPWRELHTGLEITHTELKIDGISVEDSMGGTSKRRHSNRELTVLTGILEDKMETFDEVRQKELNTMIWGDGTADPLGFLGIRAFLSKTPALGVVGGIDRATTAWWRNRYAQFALADSVIEKLHTEFRQLRRYGGRPNRAYAGSDFLDRLVKELRDKGYYTDSGWSSKETTDISIADVRYKNVEFHYDPTLDDISQADTCYIVDTRHLYVYAMQGEWEKAHAPARPHDQYVCYQAVTYTGNVVCRAMNCHGVYDLA